MMKSFMRAVAPAIPQAVWPGSCRP